MPETRYDSFLAAVLRRSGPEFGFVAREDYQADWPGELVWVMVSALVQDKGVTVHRAARIVLEFINRRGEDIPRLMSILTVSESLEQEEAAEERSQKFVH